MSSSSVHSGYWWLYFFLSTHLTSTCFIISTLVSVSCFSQNALFLRTPCVLYFEATVEVDNWIFPFCGRFCIVWFFSIKSMYKSREVLSYNIEAVNITVRHHIVSVWPECTKINQTPKWDPKCRRISVNYCLKAWNTFRVDFSFKEQTSKLISQF